jgi:phage baseplate assembly protein W
MNMLDRIKIVDEQGNDIDLNVVSEINTGAVSYLELLQNLKSILLTPQYTVSLNRLFGMEYLFVDMPVTQQRDILVKEILEKVTFWDWRIEILDVTFDPEARTIEGQTRPILHIRLHNKTYAGLPYRDYLPGGDIWPTA